MKRLVTLVSSILIAPQLLCAQDGLNALDATGVPIGACPLKHTAVEADVSGAVARVSVTQRFHNPFKEKIEAVYVFPLHQDAAVDEMTMTIGSRIIKGIIKERDEARKTYETAKSQGKAASVLSQERPNLFTQSVANIQPGHEITITLRYSQTLQWTDGRWQFDFPAVVGPRYIPGGSPAIPDRDAAKPLTDSRSPVVNPTPVPPTARVPDADRITPPVVEDGYRAGHDLSIRVNIRAGLPITDLKSALHEIRAEYPNNDPSSAIVTLAEGAVLPNRDFALSYSTAGGGITDAILTHTDERGKFLALILQPPARVEPENIVPRDLVFVLDTSGSMSGFPIETSKALVRRAINSLRPTDRFNLITFAGDTAVLFDKPVSNTPANRGKALRFLDSLHSGGGTEMMKAIEAALIAGADPEHLRVVCFLTDGYVGDDLAIIGAVQKHAGTARVFGFGIGKSVNRFLMDGMALAGRGESFTILKYEDAAKSSDIFHQRINAPVLTDISLDFGGLPVEEVHPARVADLFGSKPVVVKARYTKAGTGVLRLKGRTARGSFEREIPLTLPESNPDNFVLASQWARAAVESLMMQDMEGIQNDKPKPGIQSGIIRLGLAYNLLTQFTSFVAVEEVASTDGGPAKSVTVPLEMPDGVSRNGVFGAGHGGGFGSGKMLGVGFGAGSGGGGGFGNVPMTMKKRCSKVDRLARLVETGGTPDVENASAETLVWISSKQNADGSWGSVNQRAELTGLALLGFLGRCETPLSEKHGDGIVKATVWLTDAVMKSGGRLDGVPNDPRGAWAHAVATRSLAEAVVFNHQSRIVLPNQDEAVRKAGQWIIDHQNNDGSWDAADDDRKLLLACANLRAMKACRMTGLKFRGLAESVNKAFAWIEVRAGKNAAMSRSGPVAVAYQIFGKGSNVLARESCKAIAERAAFRWSTADLTTLSDDAQALVGDGGERWKTYNAAFLPEMLNARETDGSFSTLGIKEPTGDQTLGVTCQALLALEVYYGYLPATGGRKKDGQ